MLVLPQSWLWYWSLLCVCELPNQDSHMTHRMSGEREIPHSATFLTCPFEIPLKPAVWRKFLNLLHAICTPQRTSLCLHSPWWCLSQFPTFTKTEGQILMQITHLCQSWWGYPQHVPFGNLGRRKQMPSALWAFHAHALPALWIEKCSYSINAPFKILLQQHSSLYCNYTYCISLYSDP